VNAIQKPLSDLRRFPKSLTKHFMGFGRPITKLHENLMQTRCSILPSITDKTKREVEKALV
jgi:hypothetical protein